MFPSMWKSFMRQMQRQIKSPLHKFCSINLTEIIQTPIYVLPFFESISIRLCKNNFPEIQFPGSDYLLSFGIKILKSLEKNFPFF